MDIQIDKLLLDMLSLFFCLSILVSYNLGLSRSRLLNSLEKFNLIDGLVLDIQASVPVQHSSNLTYHEIRRVKQFHVSPDPLK